MILPFGVLMEPTPIPSTENFHFKPAFIERYSQLTDWETFKKYSLSFLRRSIRVNTLLASVSEVKKSLTKKGWQLQQIPWCKEGFWIENPERRDVGNLLEFHLGKVYVQEAASMIPPLILKPKPGELVLDMAASPGSKTTQLAALMKDEGLIIANDYTGKRLPPLGLNLQRSGVTNTLVTLMYGQQFESFSFDRILLDAPCSGTGTIRKSLKTILMWNPSMVTKIARQQQQLIEAAFANLKPGGILVYSTCSLEPEEDEGIVDYLLRNHPEAKVLSAKLPGLKSSPPVLEFGGVRYDEQVRHTLRIWPQDNDTEGFFIAKIKKSK